MNIVYRTCSAVSNKPRPEWFSKRGCWINLLLKFRDHDLHVITDGCSLEVAPYKTFMPDWGRHAVLYNIHENHNARAFLKALDYACTLDGDLYLVEDDFLHRTGAAEVLQDGLDHFDYATAYDHLDKYDPGSVGFEAERGVIDIPTVGAYCHYKSTCSTVMTFAVKAETLREDADVWRKWSQEHHGWTRDHLAFCELRDRGRTVGSSLPAYSTHCEPNWLSPLVDWEAVAAG